MWWSQTESSVCGLLASNNDCGWKTVMAYYNAQVLVWLECTQAEAPYLRKHGNHKAGEYDCCYAMCLIILTDFQLTDLLKDSHYLI